MRPQYLPDYLEASAQRYRNRVAVFDPSGASLTYGELNAQADALAAFLCASGVERGDRVGVVLPKSIQAVVALFGIMKAGAAYVPIDPGAPVERGRRMLSDCQVSAIVVDARLRDVIPESAGGFALHSVILVGKATARSSSLPTTSFEDALAAGAARVSRPRSASDLAYIIFTSGSTGVPKGVTITHENALSFIDWCSSTFQPTHEDRFSSHAPFHFDPSILDLYLSIRHGARVYLMSEELGKHPRELARFIAANRLTFWNSTPSVLMMLLQFGNLESLEAPPLRVIAFGGEVFPAKHLRELQRRWPSAAYFNLYGPTETTTACTFFCVPAVIPADRTAPYPIGFPCAHCRALVLDEDGQEIGEGEEGLLYISGPSVFAGYWNRPAETAAAFLERSGVRWYNTGDVVRWNPDEGYTYLGRKDRMVKRRGFRIELGEIERALYLHASVREAAVVSVSDADADVKIVAFLCCEPHAPSIVELKTFCGAKLPAYMNPDRFVLGNRLPRTSTDKVDYRALQSQLVESCAP